MADAQRFAHKLAALRDVLARLGDVRPERVEDFVADRDARELVALNLLVAIQLTIDLQSMVVADAGWSIPGTYRDLARTLSDHGVIEASLAARLQDAVGLRDRLAHAYDDLDWSIVHGAAADAGTDLAAAADALLVWWRSR